MKYQIGDKIIVLLTDEEGTVVDLLNDKMVMIEVKGVKFPAYMDQIDFPYFKMFTQKKPVEKRKQYIDQVRKEKLQARKMEGTTVQVSFIPVFDKDVFDDDLVEKLKVYLINNHNEDYQFHYKFYLSGEIHFELKNTIRANSDFYLHDVDFDDLSSSPKFDFEFSLVHEQKTRALYFETSLKLKGKQLFKKIEDVLLKNEASFAYDLFKEYPERVKEEKFDLGRLGNAGFRVYDASRAKDHLPPARTVVDLHIDKITDNWKVLSNAEILDMQLKAFEKHYEYALLHQLPQLIVIHGVGEGRLRDEIHELLRLKHEVKSFVNQFHPAYGYGATEIFFK